MVKRPNQAREVSTGLHSHSSPTSKKSRRDLDDSIIVLNDADVKKANGKQSNGSAENIKAQKGKKKHSQKKVNDKLQKNHELQSGGKPTKLDKADPWSRIENGSAVSAAVLKNAYVRATEEVMESKPWNVVPPGQRRTDKKKKRSCDGSLGDVERPLQHSAFTKNSEAKVDVSGGNKGTEQEKKRHEVSSGKTEKVVVSVESNDKKSGRKRRISEQLDHTDEPAERDVVMTAKEAKKKFAGMKFAENFLDDEAVEVDDEEEDEDEEDGDDNEMFLNAMLGDSDDDEEVDEDEEEVELETDEEIEEDEDEEDGIEVEGDSDGAEGDEDEEEMEEDEDEEEDGENENSALVVSPGGVDRVSRVIELNDGDGVPETDSEDDEDEGELDEDNDEEMEDESEVSEGESSEDDEEEEESSDAESMDSEASVEEAFIADRKATMVKPQSDAGHSAPPDFSAFPFSCEDSSVAATRAFAWMVANCDAQTFFDDFYQQNALVVQRRNPKYYGNLFSVKQFVELLSTEHIEYGLNVNIAEYREGVRYTLNGNGRVYPRHIQEHLEAGRSVQLVNPQSFSHNVWYLCEVLQELFGCFVGANTYLTPAGSAGFAPHWDEIDAFLLQLEGRKYWKVYAPDSSENELPLESSGNFSDGDMAGREPCFEGWIEQGDLLYIPRGFIHQASTAEQHSFHVTISVGRRWTFSNLLEKIVPLATEALATSRVKLRRGLPVGYLDMSGVAECEYRNEEQEEDKLAVPLARHLAALRRSVNDSLPVGVDLMAREFMKTALPPMLTSEEKKLSVVGAVNVLRGKPITFSAKSRVKLIRRHAQRLIFENEEKCFVVHRMSNSLVYEGRSEQSFDVDSKLVPAYTRLQSAYPEWVRLDELSGKAKYNVMMAQLLYTNGLLMVKN